MMRPQHSSIDARAVLSALSLLCALALGCASNSATLVSQVRKGPGSGVNPSRVLALSASCGSMESRCPPEYVETVDQIVRSTMGFAGYDVIEPGQLRAQTRQRHEVHELERYGETNASATVAEDDFGDEVTTSASGTQGFVERSTITLDGSGFDDLTVSEQRGVLAEAGADAFLIVRVTVGARHNVWVANQEVEVMVKLQVDSGRSMAWASRCTASSNDFRTVHAALENAARCAIDRATGS